MNGLKSVAANFKIEEFWEALSPRDNQAYTQLKQRLPRSTVCRRMFRGQTASVDGVTIEILNPPRSCPFVPKALNDQSLVLRISYGNTSFLLTGDIDKKIEKALTYSSRTLRSDVLKSPHHGSDTSSSEEFLVRVSPRIVVLTVGAGNRYNLPDPDVLERYRGIGAKVYRTDFMGAVEISSDGRNLSIRTTVKEEKIPGRGERIGRKGYRK
jgi:competence protein ComEC